MKPETFKKIIDKNLQHNPNFRTDRVVLHGYGEPLLSPFFFENLDYLQSKGFNNVDFSDNGMLLTEENMERLCKYTIFNFIKLSLNSSEKELMEYINTGSDFDKVVKNIRKFCDILEKHGNHFKLLIQLLHTAKNLDEKPEEVEKLIKRDNITVLECKIMGMLGMNPDNDLLIEGYAFWEGACVFSEVSMMYHWDGDLVGCCVDNTKSQVIGNINDDWNKLEENRKRLRDEHVSGVYDNLPACLVCEGKAK